jgi:3-carboxy-cis,cis-muconate cycloisomerase
VTQRLLDGLMSTEPLADIFSDSALIAAMLAFEVALARAEARLGLIPASAAVAIAAAAAGGAEAFDATTIAHGARASGTIAIPLVDRLRDRVHASDPAAATFVHWGATSQDVSDTGLMLCLVRVRAIVAADHTRLAAALRVLSSEHAGSVMLARTLLQPAPPTTFGLKVAGWFAAVSRSGTRMMAAFDEACVLQFGGASGTLAALGENGPAVAAELARELGLPDPGAPWHTQRDRLAALAAACGIYTGALGKVARDVSLLMQAEVAEAAEPGGGSSSMPHKRNPARCALVLAAATRAPGLVSTFLAGMPQEHERGLGGWHAEAVTLSALVQATGAALAATADMIERLSVDPGRMRVNIELTGGVVFAERAMTLLAPALGRDAAGRLIADAIEAARREPDGFAKTLAANADVRAALQPADLANLTAADAYLGAAEPFRRRLLGTE